MSSHGKYKNDTTPRAKRYITNTLVIGNGPSGLALSALLSGFRPYFDKQNRHPDENLDATLRQHADVSLFDQNLDEQASYSGDNLGRYWDQLERPQAELDLTNESVIVWRHEPSVAIQHLVVSANHSGGSWNEFPALMKTASIAKWFNLPAYTYYDYLLSNNEQEAREKELYRPTIDNVRRYFGAYAEALQLTEHMHTKVKIESLHYDKHRQVWIAKGTCLEHASMRTNCTVIYEAHIVCLASGTRIPKKLNVPGDQVVIHTLHDLEVAVSPCALARVQCSKSTINTRHFIMRTPSTPAVSSSASPPAVTDNIVDTLARRLEEESITTVLGTGEELVTQTSQDSSDSGVGLAPVTSPIRKRRVSCSLDTASYDDYCEMRRCGQRQGVQVLIVGDGLSAADAVIRCLGNGIRVHHSFKRNAKELKSTLLGKVGSNSARNRDYSIVLQAMLGHHTNCYWYQPYMSTRVTAIVDNRVTLTATTSAKAKRQIILNNIDQVIALIGWRAHIPFLEASDKGSQILSNDKKRMRVYATTNESDVYERLYACGQLAGDNFVRHMVGGSLKTARALMPHSRSFANKMHIDWPQLKFGFANEQASVKEFQSGEAVITNVEGRLAPIPRIFDLRQSSLSVAEVLLQLTSYEQMALSKLRIVVAADGTIIHLPKMPYNTSAIEVKANPVIDLSTNRFCVCANISSTTPIDCTEWRCCEHSKAGSERIEKCGEHYSYFYSAAQKCYVCGVDYAYHALPADGTNLHRRIECTTSHNDKLISRHEKCEKELQRRKEEEHTMQRMEQVKRALKDADLFVQYNALRQQGISLLEQNASLTQDSIDLLNELIDLENEYQEQDKRRASREKFKGTGMQYSCYL